MRLSSEILKVALVSSLILILSCGKKSNLGRNTYGGPNYLPPNTVQNLQAYLSFYACPNGRIPDITFSAAQFYQSSGNTTQIQGQLQPTAIGGSPSNTYVGVNLGTKDVVAITKMTGGGRVVGFNITLSLCRDIRQVNSGYGVVNIPVIDQSRMPAVGGSSAIIVTDPTNCGMGSVDQATILLNIPAYRVPNTNVTYPQFQLPISFTRANCL